MDKRLSDGRFALLASACTTWREDRPQQGQPRLSLDDRGDVAGAISAVVCALSDGFDCDASLAGDKRATAPITPFAIWSGRA